MTINRNEIEKFFEEVTEIRNLAVEKKSELIEEDKVQYAPVNPQYLGVYLSNYYSGSINKKFRKDLLK